MWTIGKESGNDTTGEPVFGVFWNGQLFRGGFSSAEEAAAKLDELKRRYRGSSPGLLLGARTSKTRRGGPYCYELPEGKWNISSTGIIVSNSKAEAREILCRWLECKRLPKGTKITQQKER